MCTEKTHETETGDKNGKTTSMCVQAGDLRTSPSPSLHLCPGWGVARWESGDGFRSTLMVLDHLLSASTKAGAGSHL